jgi:hypothetical protein
VSHYDKATGVVRISSNTAKDGRKQGRIGVEHLSNMHSNRVAFHLLAVSYVDRDWADKCHFLLQSLYECSDQWRVDVNVKDQQAIVRHPYWLGFLANKGQPGERRVFFDAAKGMLPVRVEIDFDSDVEMSPGVVERLWRQERIMMDQPKNFDGFWMATRIEERLRTSSAPETCQVFQTAVHRIVFGRVTDADLKVRFSEDTQVVDALRNVFYRTGPDGEPKGQILPVGIPKGTR